MIFNRIKKWWQSIRFYVIADPADNSITLSKALFNHIKNHAQEGDDARVFVFRISNTGSFGFMVNPNIEQSTQLCDIQYNDKYRCIGFETLCPSVGKILYDYGLNATQRVKLSVSVHLTKEEENNKVQPKIYYQFEKPHGKRIRNHPKG